MTSLHRSVRQKAPPIVVRVRRIKHRAPSAIGPRVRRDLGRQDLSGLIFYGQG
ncbi:hypothetical protein [Phenylobacterium sp.]|uniref:hypothetical protein n=1 Tax=Phenylobacterium sp. TaxID=1871053 RepID=UPI002DEAA7D0|nr:hypothetical protein [Phenylobacterium sp.]